MGFSFDLIGDTPNHGLRFLRMIPEYQKYYADQGYNLLTNNYFAFPDYLDSRVGGTLVNSRVRDVGYDHYLTDESVVEVYWSTFEVFHQDRTRERTATITEFQFYCDHKMTARLLLSENSGDSLIAAVRDLKKNHWIFHTISRITRVGINTIDDITHPLPNPSDRLVWTNTQLALFRDMIAHGFVGELEDCGFILNWLIHKREAPVIMCKQCRPSEPPTVEDGITWSDSGDSDPIWRFVYSRCSQSYAAYKAIDTNRG